MAKIEQLNQLLADLNVFYRKLQNYHWYVKGEDFFEAHAKLEEYYDQINGQVDEIAELVLMLGENPLARMKDYLEKAKIEEANNEKVSSKVAFTNVLKDFEYLLKSAKSIKEIADGESDFLTSAMMDELIASYTKNIWMIKQSKD